ncbi:MAG: NUDIX hydrolase [Candidatus Helarchaeota archaeon]|nr:NUDIX hydrolase [Candidatus Helarchaeota archaeon]
MVRYRGPRTTIDAIILEKNGSIVLIKRKYPPYQGHWALPGGFVELGERAEDAVRREAEEETGLKIEILKLSGVYSDPERDPRGHTITIAYLCKIKSPEGKLKGGTDAKEAKVFTTDDISTMQLAFDHNIIIRDALKIADKEKLW